jgi:hypothetical protein
MENFDGVCRPETILATNTSSISVTRRSPPEDIWECLQQMEIRPLIEASPPHGAQ